jgi:hypothetical protein
VTAGQVMTVWVSVVGLVSVLYAARRKRDAPECLGGRGAGPGEGSEAGSRVVGSTPEYLGA